jgi:hypothetical protein
MQMDDDTPGTRVGSGAPTLGRGSGVGSFSRSSRWEQLAPEGLLAGESSDSRLALCFGSGGDCAVLCVRKELGEIGVSLEDAGVRALAL